MELKSVGNSTDDENATHILTSGNFKEIKVVFE
jgi:hypothetical protein